MDPVSLGIASVVSMGASAAGSVLGAVGANYQGAAQSNQYMFQAGQAEQNRRIALQNAEYERIAGGEEAMKQALKDRFNIGMTRAARGASGLALDTGTNADIEESQRLLARHETDVIRSNAARRAYGYDVEAATQAGNASMYRAAAANARTAGRINAAASIIGGISSVSSQWARGSASGLFGGGGTSAYTGGMGNPTRMGSLY